MRPSFPSRRQDPSCPPHLTQLPGHTAVSWHEHYRKKAHNTHDINCRIERILLRQKRAREEDKKRRRQEDEARDKNGASGDKDRMPDEEEAVDQLASDSDGQVVPVASSSKAGPAALPKPKPKVRTSSNGSARGNSPPSSDDDDDDESSPDSDIEVQKGGRGKRAAGRAQFTDDDFDLCVRMMADREKFGYSKVVLYTKLAEEVRAVCPRPDPRRRERHSTPFLLTVPRTYLLVVAILDVQEPTRSRQSIETISRPHPAQEGEKASTASRATGRPRRGRIGGRVEARESGRWAISSCSSAEAEATAGGRGGEGGAREREREGQGGRGLVCEIRRRGLSPRCARAHGHPRLGQLGVGATSVLSS